MKNDNLYIGTDAMQGLMRGIKKISDAVAVTMGSAGKNSLLEDFARPHFHPTNDGFSIAAAIQLADPMENLGASILKEAINRANRNSGDGSSSTCLLCSSVLEEGIKHLGEASPMDIKRSLEDCVPLIEESLKSQRKMIVKDGIIDFKLLEQVAAISAEDPAIGKMIAEIYSHIGPEGIVSWDSSKTSNDSYTIGSGIKIEGATYASRWMCDDENGGPGTQATMENPYVILADSKITSETELEKVYSELIGQGIKELVIFCNEMDEPVLRSFTVARLPNSQGGVGFRFLVIKMPVVFNDLWWEDLEKASGGRVINRASGIKMKDVNMSFLGRFGRITVTATDTLVDGIKDLTTHILALKVDGSDESLARAARLNTKTARYLVGALSDSTLRQKRDKVEDAVNSAWCAMQNGILPGGGVALVNAAKILPVNVGGEIMRKALKTPMKQIMSNAGYFDKEKDKQDWHETYNTNQTNGFNSKTGNIVDMFDAGIVDSFDVVLGAVKSAIGVAAGILTCSTVVLLPRQEDSITEQIAGKVTQMMTQK